MNFEFGAALTHLGETGPWASACLSHYQSADLRVVLETKKIMVNMNYLFKICTANFLEYANYTVSKTLTLMVQLTFDKMSSSTDVGAVIMKLLYHGVFQMEQYYPIKKS